MFVGRDAADNPRPEYLLTQGSRIAREDPARGSGTTKVGDVVVPGDVLGRSGAANGVDHLHFAMTAGNYDDDDETRSVNPVPLVRAHVGGPSACAASASPNSRQKPTPARLGSRGRRPCPPRRASGPREHSQSRDRAIVQREQVGSRRRVDLGFRPHILVDIRRDAHLRSRGQECVRLKQDDSIDEQRSKRTPRAGGLRYRPGKNQVVIHRPAWTHIEETFVA